jgi:hypothetical protein
MYHLRRIESLFRPNDEIGTPKRDMSGTDSSSPITPNTSLHNRQRGGIILSLEDNSDTISKRGRYDKLHV